MHVGVADQGVEDQAADELADPGLARFQPEHLGDVAVGAFVVLLRRIDAEDLGEVLNVDRGPFAGAVEAADGEGILLELAQALGQTLDLIEG